MSAAGGPDSEGDPPPERMLGDGYQSLTFQRCEQTMEPCREVGLVRALAGASLLREFPSQAILRACIGHRLAVTYPVRSR